MPESGPAKRFLIGTKRLMPFGQLFTLLCRNHEGGRKIMLLNGLQKSSCHGNIKQGLQSGNMVDDVIDIIDYLRNCNRLGTISIS